MLDQNPIYDFLKSNKLTDLDEKSFVSKYSAPDKAKEIHSFFVENKLTDLDSASFYDKYLKKKDQQEEVSPSVSSLTKSQLVSPNFEKGKAFAEKGFLMQPEGTKAPKEQEVEPVEKQGLILNTISSLDKSFAKNLISSPIKAFGTALQGATKKVMGGTGKGFVSDNLIKFGDYLNKTIDELTPQDEEFKGTLLDQVAQAFGQVGSLVFTGGITGAAGKGAALVSQVPKGSAAVNAAKTLGSQLASPTAVSAGLSMGQAEFDRAIEAGANDDQAFEAFYKNAAVGSVLETIPVMQFFKRFNNTTGGSVANYIKTKGVAGLTGGIEEMTTEVMQQLYSNKTAKDIYNINQDILDGVGSSGGIGFGVGFVLNAMGANAKILRKQGKVKEADVLENQVKQYEDNIENPKVTSDKKIVAKDIVTQGAEIGFQKAVKSLDRDLTNNVITPEQYQEGIVFTEKAAQVVDKIPETVTGESRVKSMELLVERNDIKQANQILLQQKQTTDEAYHAGIDEEIKANEERIKKLDAEVYDIAKKPSKEFGGKKYIVDGEEVSQAEFEALQTKPTEVIEEVKPIRQLGTGANVYFENNKYRVNDNSKGKFLLNIQGKEEGGMAIANIEFDSPKEAVKIAKELSKIYPEGIPDAVLIDKVIDDIRNITTEVKETPTDLEEKGEPIESTLEAERRRSNGERIFAITEQDEMPVEVTSVEMLRSYAPDQLIAYKQKQEIKPTEVKEKVYNAKDLKANPEVLEEDENYHTLTYPKSFVKLGTNMRALKSSGFENAKIGDVINIFKKDYVIDGFLENKKNPNETKVLMIRVDKDGNLLREQDLSKKEQKEGRAKEFEEEEEEEIEVEEAEQVTKDDLKKAEAKFAAAEDRFKKARNKIEATQVKQAGMFGGEQKGMFAMGGEEAKSTLDPLRKATKEAKAELDDIRNRIKVQEQAQPELAPVETPYQKAVKEKIEADKKQNRQIGAEKAIVTKEIYRKVNEMDAPVDAEQIALRYFADGGKVSKDAVDEAYGSVKRAQLNTGRRELLSEEVKSKDFVQGNETLDETAHRLWEANDQRVSEAAIKDKLMAEIGNNNTRLEAAEAYLDKYNAEYKLEKEEMRMAELYKEQYLEEQAEIEKELRTPLDEQIEGEASEEHINNLINQYEAEIKGEDQQLRPKSEGEANKETSKGKVVKENETELAKDYKEVISKAGKKAKENAKKDFVERNFDNIVEKLKIQIKCPT